MKLLPVNWYFDTKYFVPFRQVSALEHVHFSQFFYCMYRTLLLLFFERHIVKQPFSRENLKVQAQEHPNLYCFKYPYKRYPESNIILDQDIASWAH